MFWRIKPAVAQRILWGCPYDKMTGMAHALSDRERADLLLLQEKNEKATRDASRTFTQLAELLATAYAMPASLVVAEGRLKLKRAANPLPSDSEVREALESLRSLGKERDRIRRALNPEGRI